MLNERYYHALTSSSCYLKFNKNGKKIAKVNKNKLITKTTKQMMKRLIQAEHTLKNQTAGETLSSLLAVPEITHNQLPSSVINYQFSRFNLYGLEHRLTTWGARIVLVNTKQLMNSLKNYFDNLGAQYTHYVPMALVRHLGKQFNQKLYKKLQVIQKHHKLDKYIVLGIKKHNKGFIAPVSKYCVLLIIISMKMKARTSTKNFITKLAKWQESNSYFWYTSKQK